MRPVNLLVLVAVALFATSPAVAQLSSPPLDWRALKLMDWPSPQSTFSGYGDSVRAAMWGHVYHDGGVELYCRTRFTAGQVVAMRIADHELSLEHAYPALIAARSFSSATRACEDSGTPKARRERELCLSAVANLHNLWPAYEPLNQSRGVVPYGELPGEGTSRPRWRIFCTDFERQRAPRQGIVEPTEAARGDLARSLLYMHFVYGLPLEPVITDVDLLLAWHAADPPDADERRREDRIEGLQPGTRNPLVR